MRSRHQNRERSENLLYLEAGQSLCHRLTDASRKHNSRVRYNGIFTHERRGSLSFMLKMYSQTQFLSF